MRYTILKGQTCSSLNVRQFTLLIICSFLLIVSFPAIAKPEQPKKPVISEVFVDTTSASPDTLITIIGSNFDNPDVSLGTQGFLTVTDWDETMIEVETPVELDGDYKLTVSQGINGKNTDEFDLTISSGGGVGPQGPVGPPGPAGASSTGGGGGLTGYQVISGIKAISVQGITMFSTGSCPVGQIAISAGARQPIGGLTTMRLQKLLYMYPSSSQRWAMAIDSQDQASRDWTWYVVCADGTP
ncbi:IPT/TIG domain-containing protein [Pseudomonadota bacterium]